MEAGWEKRKGCREEEGKGGRQMEGDKGGLRGRETVQALETDSEGDMSERLCF